MISRKTAAHYSDAQKSIPEVGSELGVDYVLDGTVRWALGSEEARRIRLAPELIRVVDDTPIWTEIYDRDVEDLFQVQSDIASEVIIALNVALQSEEKEVLLRRPTESIEAYQAYLRGLDAARGGQVFEAVRTVLEQAPGESEIEINLGWIRQCSRERHWDCFLERAQKLQIDHRLLSSSRDRDIAWAKFSRDGPTAAHPEIE